MNESITKGGRPRKFKTVEQMEQTIEAYFTKCDNHKRSVYVRSKEEMVEIEDPLPYTIEGLCLELDIDRRTLLNYEKGEGYEEFFPTIKRAKMRVQENVVRRAMIGDNVASVSIFVMKNNFGYEDRSQIEIDESYDVEI